MVECLRAGEECKAYGFEAVNKTCHLTSLSSMLPDSGQIGLFPASLDLVGKVELTTIRNANCFFFFWLYQMNIKQNL